MAEWISSGTGKLTDFTVGSALRTLLEAVAQTVEQVYFSIYRTAMWAIENSIYTTFGFDKVPAQAAKGMVTLFYPYPTENERMIPKGLRFAASSSVEGGLLYFQTTTDYTVLPGSSEADVEVECLTPGTIGNVATDAIKIMTMSIPGVSEVTNRNPFLTGSEEETTANRKQRFNRYIETLARGTKKAIEYGAKEVEGVAGVLVDDSVIGLVRVFAHDNNGNLPAGLKSRIELNLENYRAAGIPCEVLPITKRDIPVSILVTVSPSANTLQYQELLRQSVDSFLNNYPVGKQFYLSDVVQYVMNFDDVAVKNCRILAPTTDFLTQKQEIIRSSSVIVTLQT